MRKRIITLCTAGLLLASICTPAAGVYLGSARPVEHYASAAIPGKTYYEPDAEGSVSYQNLESRIRGNNLTILSLQATLDSQKAFNREKAYNDLIRGMNNMADASWMFLELGETAAANSIASASNSMREQLKSLKEDEYAKLMEKLTRQIDDAITQVIKGTQGLYISIIQYEATLGDLYHTVRTLDRTMAELELRYELGQISKLTLQEFKNTYSSTKSQIATLEYNIEVLKGNLQNLLGEAPTGKITLHDLPPISDQHKTLYHMNYDEALALGKEVSFTLFQAAKTMEDADEDFKDASSVGYRHEMALQTHQAAVFTYESTIKNFELKFQTLYQNIADYQQSLNSAKENLAFQQALYAVAETKHQLGQISDGELETARENIHSVESAVKTAEINLFVAYENYCHAVEYGYIA